MKRKIVNLFALAFLVSTTLVSCTETVDLELDNAQKILVVDGFISNDNQTHYVKLSYTTNVFSNSGPDYTAESGATVVLYENNQVIDTMKFNSATKQFETDKVGTIGNSYSIRIKTEDGTNYFSESETMNRLVPIDTIWSEFNEATGFEAEQYVVYIESEEPLGIGDHYQWKTYINGEYMTAPEWIAQAEDRIVDGNRIEEFDIVEIEADDFDKYADSNDEIDVKIEQLSITKNYYDFLAIMEQQSTDQGGMFSPPPAEIRGNIRKDINKIERAQGYFYAATVHAKSTVVTKR